MIHAPPPPILAVCPPRTPSAAMPSRLSEVEAMTAAVPVHPVDLPAAPGWFRLTGDRLMDHLAGLPSRYATRHFFCTPALSLHQLFRLAGTRGGSRPALRLSVVGACDEDAAAPLAEGGHGAAIVQIRWQLKGALPNLRFFKAFSQAGIWNHLVLNGSTAASRQRAAVALQPNIVHSWEMAPGGGQDQRVSSGYGGLPPLPGRPLWQAVADPIHRFLLVSRWGQARMCRMRIDRDESTLYAVGDAIGYHFQPPERVSKGRLDEICAMVAAGGSVATARVRNNLKNAFLIGYAVEKGVIVGNSCLKNPRPAYVDSVRRKSGLDLTGFVERGYTSVRPEYRGLGIATRLLEELTARAGDRQIFSVIGEDNTATQIIARRNRTRKVAAYLSDKTGKPVGIWMPEWMDLPREKGR